MGSSLTVGYLVYFFKYETIKLKQIKFRLHITSFKFYNDIQLIIYPRLVLIHSYHARFGERLYLQGSH